jgi:hypothetical protein
MTGDFQHVGRAWVGHAIEDACPCPQEPCGLVDYMKADPSCPHHAMAAAKTIRQAHSADKCPACVDTTDEFKARRERGVA